MAIRFWAGLGVILACINGAAAATPAPLQIEVDLSEAARGIIRNRELLPVQPGPLTLVSAQWIPGEHGPTGPVTDLVGVRLSADGRTLPWRRDPENMYALHLEIPAGVAQLEIENEYLVPSQGHFGAGPTTSPRIAVLNWNLVALYPLGVPAIDQPTVARLTVPSGWAVGTSLAIERVEGNVTHFQPTNLEMLIDQPVITGAHLFDLELTPGAPVRHVIHAAGDAPAALGLNSERQAAYRRMPSEFAALTGTRPYNTYHFLLTLSDRLGFNGLEHHQTSDNRAPENGWTDDDVFMLVAPLLTHEYFHSWNGKHRRPQSMLSPDYQRPMHGDLLWVYEGLTTYYGDVLAARCGLLTSEHYRELLASQVAMLNSRSGRQWRPLQDTADAAQLLYNARGESGSVRRGVEFYPEGALIWLEADVLIRRATQGARSLDDFVRLFFGDGQLGGGRVEKVPSFPPHVRSYVEADVYAALQQVYPHDWPRFFAERVKTLQPQAPIGGLEAAGWRLVRSSEPNRWQKAEETLGKYAALLDTVGFSYSTEDGTVYDVARGSPADQAGLFVGVKLLGVNGRKFTPELLLAALKASPQTGTLELIGESGTFLQAFTVRYQGGTSSPHLQRLEGSTDLLEAILAPRAR